MTKEEEQEQFKLIKSHTWILKVYIHCEACKKKVRKVLHNIDGVFKISIDGSQQKVTVEGTVESPDVLLKKLSKAGKRAELLQPPSHTATEDQSTQPPNGDGTSNGKPQDGGVAKKKKKKNGSGNGGANDRGGSANGGGDEENNEKEDKLTVTDIVASEDAVDSENAHAVEGNDMPANGGGKKKKGKGGNRQGQGQGEGGEEVNKEITLENQEFIEGTPIMTAIPLISAGCDRDPVFGTYWDMPAMARLPPSSPMMIPYRTPFYPPPPYGQPFYYPPPGYHSSMFSDDNTSGCTIM
eukprot:TRINITY_DN35241_c0_g1_i1.p1 TRINITY_DN35241_c0_g1~~TRINITY_DN35241_c0_g1_i1.p1  ORF type:complete len:296 (+),score=36.21 TRINITY_DN35241_c0_g1_i1:279-1166(+)